MALLNSNFVLTARLGERDIKVFYYNCTSLEETLEQFWYNDYPMHLIDRDDSALFPIDIICMHGDDGPAPHILQLTFNCAVFNHFFDKGWSVSSREPNKHYTFEQFLNDISRESEFSRNDVTSFMFYMWNAWCEEECQEAFKDDGWKHFWSKWCHCCTIADTAWGATEHFYSELSDFNRNRLVRRALAVYDGRHDKRNKYPPPAGLSVNSKKHFRTQT